MSLLALEHVEKAYGSGSGRHVVLRDVSLEIEAGEMVAVWGLRRSGRSTLLRVAAGIEAPDAGSVRFEGHDLRGRSRGREALGEQIGYCRKSWLLRRVPRVEVPFQQPKSIPLKPEPLSKP